MAKARTLTLKTKVEVTGADKLNNLGKRMQQTGRNLTVGLTLPLAALGGALVALAEKQERAEAKLTASFNSMGAAAWTTVDALKAQASAIQETTTFGDEEILELQSVLLTFGNVTGESFERATAAAADMSALLGQDLQSSAIQLGKALNDPIRGVTALRRVGVSFTEQQLEQIRVMTEAGDVAAAQGIILAEVERQFGNAAEALAQTAGGQMKQAINALGDAGEQFGAIIAPLLRDFAGFLKDVAKWLQTLNPETKEWIVRIAALLAVLGPALIVLGSLVRAIATLTAVTKGAAAATGLPKLIGLLKGLRLASLGVLGPIGLVAAGLAALTAVGTELHRSLDPIGHTFNELASQVGKSRVQIEGEVNQLAQQLGVEAQVVRERLTRLLAEGIDWDAAVEAVRDGTGRMADELLASTIRHRQLVEEFGNNWASAGSIIRQNLAETAGLLPQTLQDAQDEAAEIARQTPGALANALRADIGDYEKELQELADVAANSVSDLSERQVIEATLASQELTEALNSDSTRTRLLAQEFVNDLISDYELLAPGALEAGELVNPALKLGIQSNLNLATEAGQAIVDAAGNQLLELPDHAFDWGYNTAVSFGNGITVGKGVAVRAVTDLANQVREIVAINSEPEDPNSPLRGITKWGGNMVKTIADGIYGALGIGSGASSALAGALVPGFGGVAALPVSSVPASGGGDIHVHLTVMGDLRADERTLPGTLRRAFDVGVN